MHHSFEEWLLGPEQVSTCEITVVFQMITRITTTRWRCNQCVLVYNSHILHHIFKNLTSTELCWISWYRPWMTWNPGDHFPMSSCGSVQQFAWWPQGGAHISTSVGRIDTKLGIIIANALRRTADESVTILPTGGALVAVLLVSMEVCRKIFKTHQLSTFLSLIL